MDTPELNRNNSVATSEHARATAFPRRAAIFSLFILPIAMALNGRTYHGDWPSFLNVAGRVVAFLAYVGCFSIATKAAVQSWRQGAKRVFVTALAGFCLNGLAIVLTLNYMLFAPDALEIAKKRNALSADQEVGPGTLTNRVYHNGYLGFYITIPPGWAFQGYNQTESDLEISSGTSGMAGGSTTDEKARSYEKVTLFRLVPVSDSASPQVSMIATALRVRHLRFIQSSKDSLLLLKRHIDSNTSMSSANAPYVVRCGNADLDTMELDFRVGDTQMTRTVYSSLRNGYVLFFTTAHVTLEEKQALQSSLETLRFQ